MIIPNYGIFFTLSAFYGGNKTSGDEAKKMFLNSEKNGKTRKSN